MDNHSIEELKRQRDSARSKAQDAAKAYEAAKARLEAALAEESGWLGQVVEVNASRYLVREVQSLSDSPWKLLASPFKKDGKPSNAVHALYLSANIVKLGQYEPA